MSESTQKGQGDDDKLTLILPEVRSENSRLKGFNRKRAKAMKFEDSEMDQSSDDEYEETLLYVDLDDIPSVDELFAVEPDDFLTCQSKRQREIQKKPKPLHPHLKLKFYNMDSTNPILQIGSRYYSGVYQEPLGSHLMFQDKSPDPVVASSSKTVSDTFPHHKRKLPSIIPEMRPPKDKIFGETLCTDQHAEYEMVANVQKVLKMTREVFHYHGEEPPNLPPTPGGLPAPVSNSQCEIIWVPHKKPEKSSTII